MSDQYIAEIRAVSFNYAPQGWHLCDGSILQVSQFQALYALIGNMYGGTPGQTFALPDLMGRSIVGAGNGAGLNPVPLGQKQGSNTVSLTQTNLPPHTHVATVIDSGHTHGMTVPAHTHPFSVPCTPSGVTPTSIEPEGNVFSSTSAIEMAIASSSTDPGALPLYAQSSAGTAAMAGANTGAPSSTSSGNTASATSGITVTNALSGAGAAFPVQPPMLGLYYIIALEGIWPSRP